MSEKTVCISMKIPGFSSFRFYFFLFFIFFNCVLFVKPFNFVSRDVRASQTTFERIEPNFGRSDIKLQECFMVRR